MAPDDRTTRQWGQVGPARDGRCLVRDDLHGAGRGALAALVLHYCSITTASFSRTMMTWPSPSRTSFPRVERTTAVPAPPPMAAPTAAPLPPPVMPPMMAPPAAGSAIVAASFSLPDGAIFVHVRVLMR